MINENEAAVANRKTRESILLICLVLSWIFFIITWLWRELIGKHRGNYKGDLVGVRVMKVVAPG